jgi:hypothetical protein
MLHKFFESGDWFAPKRYGYGAGLPIAWQGWALLLAYVGVVAGLAVLADAGGHARPLLAFIGIVAATALLIVVARRRTRGGWRWRWGAGR